MVRTGAIALTALFSTAAAATSANAAIYLNAGPSDLCGKGGCFQDSLTYRQTFGASPLAAVQSISGLTISKAMLGALQDHAVKITFTRADGTVVSDWGAYTLSVLGGDVVTVNGQAFAWDQSQGDLVLTLTVLAPGKGGGFGGFGGGGGLGGGGTASAPFEAGSGPGVGGLGGPGSSVIARPLPGIIEQAVVAVPEPQAWALMLLGFGGAGAMLRRRRQLAAA